MESAYKLAIEIVANAKNFEVNINKAGGAVDNIAEKTREATGKNSELAGSFQNVSAMAGKAMGVLAAVGGTVAFLKSSIEAVEGPGDKFEEVISGAKSAVFEFQRAIVTTDFSNFLENLKEGYLRGKDFAAAMDELKDISAYGDYVIAKKKAESAELQETIKNKTLELATRRNFAEQRNKIEEDIMNRTQTLAQKRFIIEKENWERINKMSTEQAIQLYEFIDSLTGEQATKMSEMFKLAEDQLGWRNKKGTVEVVMGRTGFSRASVEAYKEYLDLMRTGEADVLPKLFAAYKNVDQVRFESQRTYNNAVRETSMLLQQEEKATKSLIETLKDKINYSSLGYKLGTAKAGGAEKAGYSDVDQTKKGSGFFAKSLILPGGINNLIAYNGYTREQIDLMTKVNEELTSEDILVNTLSTSFTNMFTGIDDGFRGLAMSIVNQVKQMAIQLMAQTAIFGLLKLLFPGASLVTGGLKAFLGFAAPKMAAGGLAYGPTFAQVGEYPGARQDPEVISPLSKLRDIIGSQQAVPQRMRLTVEGGGLIGYFEYQQRKTDNYR